jgi:uncharacterized membrane protein HdeD (DUF308 family)
MTLTKRDMLATMVVVGVVAIGYAAMSGYNWPLVSSWRMGTLALFILGFGAYIIGRSDKPIMQNNWTFIAGACGIGAVIVTVFNLFADSETLFITLIVDIVLLWVLTTLHRLVSKKEVHHV